MRIKEIFRYRVMYLCGSMEYWTAGEKRDECKAIELEVAAEDDVDAVQQFEREVEGGNTDWPNHKDLTDKKHGSFEILHVFEDVTVFTFFDESVSDGRHWWIARKVT